MKPTMFEAGKGLMTVTTGRIDGKPAIFMAPSRYPGEVGASAEREGRPKDRLLGDEVIITFPTPEQSIRVADALCNVPADNSAALAEIARLRQAREVKEADIRKAGQVAIDRLIETAITYEATADDLADYLTRIVDACVRAALKEPSL